MAQPLVNLDALIPREDFEVTESHQQLSVMIQHLNVSELAPNNFTYQVLRKPDFQRETANWSPENVADLIQSFLDGDLIPAIILWRSPGTGNLFIIDGAHRLSAIIAWVHDDYGDGKLSRAFYSNLIPPEQEQAAEKTRRLVAQKIGSYAQIVAAGQNPAYSKPEHVVRARNLGAVAVQLQWVRGDAKRAEESFFKINQKATPIEATELAMIISRSKPNAIAVASGSRPQVLVCVY